MELTPGNRPRQEYAGIRTHSEIGRNFLFLYETALEE